MLFREAKGLEGNPELDGLVASWNSTSGIAASFRRLRCLEIPTQTAGLETAESLKTQHKTGLN